MRQIYLAVLLTVSACAELEKEKELRVVVSGQSGLTVNSTVALTAMTLNGTDSKYTWTSANPAVARVDEQGIVTGLAKGETEISALGVDSKATGTHPIVVEGTPLAPPYFEQWLSSAHADQSAEPFNHWNQEGEIPTTCAKCHSQYGFSDFIGADGSTVGQVDAPAQIGSVINCDTCHNDTARALSSVTFPSGVVINDLGGEAKCMTCHQGRASTDSVNQFITDSGAAGPDATNADLRFQNIHYYAAAATLFAGEARGGYQYEGQVYDWRFRHVPGYNTCIGCHDPHSLKVRVDRCVECHQGVSTVEDLKNVRMLASKGQDYDADGNTNEGIYYELRGVRDQVFVAMTLYAAVHALDTICYDGSAYPYFFKDSNGSGACDPSEVSASNGYSTWTPRLLKAAYNYQVATKDPGAFAHNAKYIIQLLHDSIADLGTVNLTSFVRNDFGHFNGASEAARHWDVDEEVSASCSKCHGGSDGFRFFLTYGVGKTVDEQANGLDCATCHENFGTTFDLVSVNSVTYPSGIKVTRTGSSSNLCSTCHSGRESKATIDAAIAANSFSFRNVHYLPSGAVKAGTDAKVGYEYTGKTYVRTSTTHPGGNECVDCHQPLATQHTFDAHDAFEAPGGCGSTCHLGTPTVEDIRGLSRVTDYDGDLDAAEPLKEEINTLSNALLDAMRVPQSVGSKICYNETAYPYFFKDTNNSGRLCDPSESTNSNRFGPWNAILMKAAHNFQISRKDPGAWAHNFNYITQLLIDSIEDAGGSVAGYTRP